LPRTERQAAASRRPVTCAFSSPSVGDGDVISQQGHDCDDDDDDDSLGARRDVTSPSADAGDAGSARGAPCPVHGVVRRRVLLTATCRDGSSRRP
jgi:hypothetical protein